MTFIDVTLQIVVRTSAWSIYLNTFAGVSFFRSRTLWTVPIIEFARRCRYMDFAFVPFYLLTPDIARRIATARPKFYNSVDHENGTSAPCPRGYPWNSSSRKPSSHTLPNLEKKQLSTISSDHRRFFWKLSFLELDRMCVFFFDKPHLHVGYQNVKMLQLELVNSIPKDFKLYIPIVHTTVLFWMC